MSDLALYEPNARSFDGGVAHIPSAGGNLGAIIDRIEEAIDVETASLRGNADFDIKASNTRKSRHLYDLTKAIKAFGGTLPAQYAESLQRLRAKLERNEQAILAHMSAVGEVAGMIRDAIQRADTDGTYSSTEFGRAP